jgi:FAD-linked sulfhydryl oxidase
MARQQQQCPWWAEPLQGVGAALQGMQRFADGIARPGPPGSPLQASVTLAATPAAATAIHQRRTDSSSMQRHPDVAALNVSSSNSKQQHGSKPTSKEDLGRATWTFLHTLAAQFPEHPTRQQQRDARQLIDSLTRIYPCADCASHFQELVRCAAAAPAACMLRTAQSRNAQLWACVISAPCTWLASWVAIA